MIPNLLLLGAQKSASTYTSRWLGAHPQIHIAKREDQSFEDPNYAAFDLKALSLDEEHTIYGIRRPDYFGNDVIHERLHRWLPDARILIVLRDPVERALSAYYHYMKKGIIPAKKNTLLLQVVKGEADKAYGAYANILRYGEYHALLTHLEKYYPRDRIMLVAQRALIGPDSENAFESILRFLNVPLETVEKPSTIPQRSTYNYRRLAIRNLSAGARYDYDPARTKSIRKPAGNRSAWDRLVISSVEKVEAAYCHFDNGSDPIDGRVVEALREYYRADLGRLKRDYGMDITDWLDE